MKSWRGKPSGRGERGQTCRFEGDQPWGLARSVILERLGRERSVSGPRLTSSQGP